MIALFQRSDVPRELQHRIGLTLTSFVSVQADYESPAENACSFTVRVERERRYS